MSIQSFYTLLVSQVNSFTEFLFKHGTGKQRRIKGLVAGTILSYNVQVGIVRNHNLVRDMVLPAFTSQAINSTTARA